MTASVVKVRKKKNISEFEKQFNESFFMEFDDLRNRAVFVNGEQPSGRMLNPSTYFRLTDTDSCIPLKCSIPSELYKDTFDKLIEASGTEGMDIFPRASPPFL